MSPPLEYHGPTEKEWEPVGKVSGGPKPPPLPSYVLLTTNDCPFGYPIIDMDTVLNDILFIDHWRIQNFLEVRQSIILQNDKKWTKGPTSLAPSPLYRPM